METQTLCGLSEMCLRSCKIQVMVESPYGALEHLTRNAVFDAAVNGLGYWTARMAGLQQFWMPPLLPGASLRAHRRGNKFEIAGIEGDRKCQNEVCRRRHCDTG